MPKTRSEPLVTKRKVASEPEHPEGGKEPNFPTDGDTRTSQDMTGATGSGPLEVAYLKILVARRRLHAGRELRSDSIVDVPDRQ